MTATVYDCEEESEIEEKPPPAVANAMAPAPVAAAVTDPADLAALKPPYSVFPGTDYGPLQEPPPDVAIADIGPRFGLVVADAVDCATACTAVPACNAASYHGDNPTTGWPGTFCHLHTHMYVHLAF